jgi:hypothetical protein
VQVTRIRFSRIYFSRPQAVHSNRRVRPSYPNLIRLATERISRPAFIEGRVVRELSNTPRAVGGLSSGRAIYTGPPQTFRGERYNPGLTHPPGSMILMALAR